MEKPYALPSSFGTYCFEDHDIIVESILEEFPEIREDMHEITGGDGSVLRSTYLGPRTITLECRAFRDKWLDFDSLRSELAAMLYTRDERELALRSHFGEHYMAHLSGMVEGDREGGVGIGAITLTFTASDPIRFGSVHEVTVPSGGMVEIDVAGTYPASMSLETQTATRSLSLGVWGIRFDEGHPLHVKLPTGQQSAVSIDCHDASVTINGVTGMITLDSHWPELTPGSHVVRMDQGTGNATLRWQERWIEVYPTNRIQLFDKDCNPIRELAPREVLSRVRHEEINGEHALTIETTRHLEVGWRALTVDSMGRWREWVVEEPDETHDSGLSATGTYRLVWSLQYDLSHTYDYTGSLGHREVGISRSASGSEAVALAIRGTRRWTVGTCDVQPCEVGNGVVMIAESAWDCLSKVVDAWGGELDATIEVGLDGVTARRVNLLEHVGVTEPTRRFEWGRDLTSISRKPDPGPYYCRVIPTGKTHKEYAEGNGREDADSYEFDWPLSILDDPEYNPTIATEYIEDEESALVFRVSDGMGGWEYPTKVVKYDQDDVQLLYEEAVEDLHNHTRPNVTYEATVMQLAEAGMDPHGVDLGDEIQIVDWGFNPDFSLAIQERVTDIKVDELDDYATELTIGEKRESLIERLAGITRDVSRVSNGFDFIDTDAYVEALLDRINKEINATGGYSYLVPGEGLLTFDVAVRNPMNPIEASQAVQIKGGSIRIANSRRPDGSWDWKSVFQSGHIVTELVTSGMIETGYVGNPNGNSFWDLDADKLRIGADASVGDDDQTMGALINGVWSKVVGVEVQTQWAQTDTYMPNAYAGEWDVTPPELKPGMSLWKRDEVTMHTTLGDTVSYRNVKKVFSSANMLSNADAPTDLDLYLANAYVDGGIIKLQTDLEGETRFHAMWRTEYLDYESHENHTFRLSFDARRMTGSNSRLSVTYGLMDTDSADDGYFPMETDELRGQTRSFALSTSFGRQTVTFSVPGNLTVGSGFTEGKWVAIVFSIFGYSGGIEIRDVSLEDLSAETYESAAARYYLSTSADEPTGGEWSYDPPVWEEGCCIWTRTELVGRSTTYTEPDLIAAYGVLSASENANMSSEMIRGIGQGLTVTRSELTMAVLDASRIATDYLTYRNGKLILGATDSAIKNVMTNSLNSFEMNGRAVAYFGYDEASQLWQMYIANAQLTDMLRFGDFAWIARQNGNMTLKWTGA